MYTNNMKKNIPIYKTKGGLTERYTLTMSPELKRRLIELKMFQNIDVSLWIRNMIEDNLKKLENKHT